VRRVRRRRRRVIQNPKAHLSHSRGETGKCAGKAGGKALTKSDGENGEWRTSNPRNPTNPRYPTNPQNPPPGGCEII